MSTIQIKAWRSFNIGNGKVIDLKDIKYDSNDLTPATIDILASHENTEWKRDSSREGISFFFSVLVILLTEVIGNDLDATSSSEEENEDDLSENLPMDSNEEDQTAAKGPVEDSSAGFIIFRCSDPQCIKWYRSVLRCEDHILSGQHIYPAAKLSLLDTAVTKYKIKTDQIDFDRDLTSTTNIATSPVTSDSCSLVEGWALVQPKSNKRFTSEQIAFLVGKYDEGESSGNKWNPAAVAAVSFLFELSSTMILVFRPCELPRCQAESDYRLKIISPHLK